jgi:molybdate transport system substrate-binding protein
MTSWVLLAALVAGLTLTGCGGEGADGGAAKPTLTVSAAASLKQAFTQYGKGFRGASARFSFAGSDELAAQIEQGVKPDVFAAANAKLPGRLFARGLVEKPSLFAGNRLVLAVPARDSGLTSLADLEREGIALAIGSGEVPVGSYTRTVLDRLKPEQRRAILANVRSEEPDVAGIAGKLTQGAVDAGFLYVSDVRASAGELRTVELPERLQPSIAYAAAVVKGAKQPGLAREFIAGLRSGAGARALEDAGLEPPPAR